MKFLCTNNPILIVSVITDNIVIDISIPLGRMNIGLPPTFFYTTHFCIFTGIIPYFMQNLHHIKNCWFYAKFNNFTIILLFRSPFSSQLIYVFSIESNYFFLRNYFVPSLKARNYPNISRLYLTCNVWWG